MGSPDEYIMGQKIILKESDIPILATDKFIREIKEKIIDISPKSDIPELKRLLKKFNPNSKKIINLLSCIIRRNQVQSSIVVIEIKPGTLQYIFVAN